MRISRPSDLMGRHLLLVTLVMGLTFAGFAALGLQVVRESTDRTLEERRVIALTYFIVPQLKNVVAKMNAVRGLLPSG